MEVSRRAVLGAAAAVPLLAVARGRPSAPAAAGTTREWMQNGWTVHLLYAGYPSNAAWAFNTPASYLTGDVHDGLAAAVVQRFTSYATFSAQVGSIPAGTAVLYDNENWADTPQAEIDDPWTYLAGFASLAHANSLVAAVSPARDLGLDPASVNPRQPRERLDAWYLRTGIPAAAAAADIYVVQSQADTTSPGAFLALFNGAYDAAVAASPACRVFAGLSHNYGTPGQAYAAATQDGIRPWAGIFYNGADDAAALAAENGMLQLFRDGGY